MATKTETKQQKRSLPGKIRDSLILFVILSFGFFVGSAFSAFYGSIFLQNYRATDDIDSLINTLEALVPLEILNQLLGVRDGDLECLDAFCLDESLVPGIDEVEINDGGVVIVLPQPSFGVGDDNLVIQPPLVDEVEEPDEINDEEIAGNEPPEATPTTRMQGRGGGSGTGVVVTPTPTPTPTPTVTPTPTPTPPGTVTNTTFTVGCYQGEVKFDSEVFRIENTSTGTDYEVNITIEPDNFSNPALEDFINAGDADIWMFASSVDSNLVNTFPDPRQYGSLPQWLDGGTEAEAIQLQVVSGSLSTVNTVIDPILVPQGESRNIGLAADCSYDATVGEYIVFRATVEITDGL